VAATATAAAAATRNDMIYPPWIGLVSIGSRAGPVSAPADATIMLPAVGFDDTSQGILPGM
jgi:hypothetical protein